MPVVGLGTWQSSPGEIGQVIKTVLDIGYRHFDCAQVYGNEAEIGEALEVCVNFILTKKSFGAIVDQGITPGSKIEKNFSKIFLK